MTKQEITIGGRKIGTKHPVFIIAELSGNHHHDIVLARKLIDSAAEAKVDAVKLQTYTPDTITLQSDKEYFRVKVNDSWKGKTLYDLYKEAYTPWEWHKELKEYAESKGLIFFSTPFDSTAVDFLEDVGVPIYKVASFEIVDIPLLKKIGSTGKPVIMSRGMANVEEINLAIKTLKENGTKEIALLHCVSSYPADPSEMNLATVADISKKFDVISGLSDHSLDLDVSLLAVLLGASIIEKHIILKREEGGPDANFSLESAEFKDLVKKIRNLEEERGDNNKIEKEISKIKNAAVITGKPTYESGEKEKENSIFRKSLFVTKNIKKGEIFTENNIRSVRPGFGLAPKYYEEILGKTATKDIEYAEPLKWNMIEK